MELKDIVKELLHDIILPDYAQTGKLNFILITIWIF